MLRKRWIAILTIMLLMTIGSGSVIRAESVWDNLSLGIEKEIGYLNYETIMATKTTAQLRPGEAERVQRVFTRLVATCQRNAEIKYTVTVVEDPSVNAFALPGGYVFVNTGLLDFVQSDDELAGVLGHELAHVECRHSMKAITRSVGMSAMVSAALRGGQDDLRKNVIQKMANFSIVLLELGFSRDAEYQADQYGVRFMEKAGYNKEQLLNFWQRNLQLSGGSSGFLTAFSTHPPTAERMKRIAKMK